MTHVMPFICYLVSTKNFEEKMLLFFADKKTDKEAKKKAKRNENNNTDSLKERACISIPTFLRQMFTLFLLFHAAQSLLHFLNVSCWMLIGVSVT